MDRPTDHQSPLYPLVVDNIRRALELKLRPQEAHASRQRGWQRRRASGAVRAGRCAGRLMPGPVCGVLRPGHAGAGLPDGRIVEDHFKTMLVALLGAVDAAVQSALGPAAAQTARSAGTVRAYMARLAQVCPTLAALPAEIAEARPPSTPSPPPDRPLTAPERGAQFVRLYEQARYSDAEVDAASYEYARAAAHSLMRAVQSQARAHDAGAALPRRRSSGLLDAGP